MRSRTALFRVFRLFAASCAATCAFGAVAACGGAPPPPPAAPAATTPTAAAPPAPPPDLSAVQEPKNLTVFARVNKPSEALKVMGGWTSLPMPGADAVSELVTGETIGALVDLDQPIDFALVASARGMSVKSSAAISAAVKSLDAAKAALTKYKLVPADNGALKIEGLGVPPAGDDDGGGMARVCELAPSFGLAGTRIVCGDSDAALEALAPYLTRGATRTTFPADIHVEARLEPIRATVEQSRRAAPLLLGSLLGMHRSGNAAQDEAFNASVGDLVDLALDTDKVAFDAMLADAKGTLTLTANFRGATSFVARLATAHPERAAAPPDTFWRLPGDADAAFFHRGIDAKDFEHPRDHVVAILDASLQKEGLTAAADRKALSDAASHTLSLLADPSVYAKGLDLAEAQKALAAVKAAKPGDDARAEAERIALERMAGWSVIGVEEAPSKVVAIAKEWPAAWARPGVAKWVKTQATDAPPPVVATAPMPKGLTAGKDALHLTITVHRPVHTDRAESKKGDPKKPEKKAAPGKPVVLHLLVLPDTDGTRTWLVMAADEAQLVAKAKGLLSPADASSLGKHGGFEAMREAKISAGGFLSARGLAIGNTVAWVVGQRYGALHPELLDAFAQSPQQGATPVPFTFTTQAAAGGASGGTFVGTATVPKAAIEDVVHAVMQAMRR